MRGTDTQQSGMFSYVSPEERVPERDPLRAIRRMTDEVLQGLSAKFNELYSAGGRPSIAPENAMKAITCVYMKTPAEPLPKRVADLLIARERSGSFRTPRVRLRSESG